MSNDSPMIADSPMIGDSDNSAYSSGSFVPIVPAPPPVSGVQTRLKMVLKIRKIY
jgi:hypothetical protein